MSVVFGFRASAKYVTRNIVLFGARLPGVSRDFGHQCFSVGVTLMAPTRPTHPMSRMSYLADAPQKSVSVFLCVVSVTERK